MFLISGGRLRSGVPALVVVLVSSAWAPNKFRDLSYIAAFASGSDPVLRIIRRLRSSILAFRRVENVFMLDFTTGWVGWVSCGGLVVS